MIATGHRSANEAASCLGPFDGPGHSLMSPPEEEEARTALSAFLAEAGPMVLGCAPAASCIGPAYEFAFEIDHLLRKRKMRYQVPIAFVTPEPFLRHFGGGGVGKARQFLEGEFDEQDIRYYISAAVSEISESSVALSDGMTFESQFSMVIPPLAGVDAITNSPDVGNSKGFVPMGEQYRHTQVPSIYAVEVAVALPPVDETAMPVNSPKASHITEQMAVVAARNIAADVTGSDDESPRPLAVECILDMGDRAAHIKADPVRPPRNTAVLSEGRRWLWPSRSSSATTCGV